MRAVLIAFITLLLLPLAAMAQSTDRPNTILVLDGSGSMWGQIDGVNKIVIAREVIADLLADMADDVSLGLTVYGHRQRGSCTDIETIVPPAPGTRDQILEAVNAINPRGRTPMTDAVIAAAQSLRSTEEAATVILVSDGIENCNPDPCAIAAELEASGVDFTAHVIGFDVASEPEARAQMQCIADNTGGQFLTADNATELSQALEQIVAVLPTPMRIEAQVLPQGTLPTRPVTWTLLDEAGAVLSSGTPGPAIDISVFPGTYVAQATRTEPDGPQTYQTSFTVIEGQTDLIIVAMPPIIETSQITFTARVEPDMSVPASSLAWTLYDSTNAAILGPVVAPGGNVALLPGDYRLEVLRENAGTRHEALFTVEPNTAQEVIIPLPALAVEVDFVARIGSVGGVTITDPVIWDIEPLSTNPVTTNPATFLLTRGAYRVTAYWTAQETEQSTDFVIIDQPREIIVVFPEPVATATLTGPAQAPMGSMVQVGWDGPANEGDAISFGPVGAPAAEYVNRTLVEAGTNPATVLMPAAEGPFEIRYTDATTRRVIARVPILSTPVTATLTVPEEVSIGSEFEVAWTGPNYTNDRIAISAPDAGTNSYTPGRQPTADGPVVTMTAPTEPGVYEVRYRMDQDGVILARALINVVDEIASLSAPASAVAGSTVEVAWTGPGNDNDFIGITPADGEGYHRFANSTRTNEGALLDVLMPPEAGDYVLEYVLGEGRTRIVAVPITVTPAAATLTSPTTAVAGSTVEIGWTGPNYTNDFIAVTEVGSEGYHRFANTTRTNEGSPLSLLMPVTPGSYIVEYVEGQNRTAITTAPITVTEPSATLTAPASAVAGSSVEIGWTGPGYDNDFIGITPVGGEGYHRFSETTRLSDGNPLELQMPTEPGEYVLEYVLGQDRAGLVSQPITITELGATLTGPASAIAGSVVEIGWTGPGYETDFVAITPLNAEGYYRFAETTRVSEGNPVRLQMPTQPGDYMLEYALGQDRTALVTVPITITELGATLTGPASAIAGSVVEIGWTGPAYEADFVAITPLNAEGFYRFGETTPVSEGNPVRLQMPTQPGNYMLEYALGQDRTALVTVPITVTELQATLTAPATAVAASTIEVGFTGPGYPNDFIAITRVGSEGFYRFAETTPIDGGATVQLQIPVEAGSYVIEYALGQDRTGLASVPIEITAVDASLTLPATAVAGSTIDVGWTGPNADGDYIGIGPVGGTGSDQWRRFTYTNEGNPVSLLLPGQAGTYVVRYFVGRDQTILAEAEITLSEPPVTITAPASALAASTIDVIWTGPNYSGDFIALGTVGGTGSDQWRTHTDTSAGSPMRLQVPPVPGEYLLRYFIDNDRTAIHEQPFTVLAHPIRLDAPRTAPAGSELPVTWSGPGFDGDFIAVGPVGATGSDQWRSYTYTSDGQALTVTLPDEPGEYILRYILDLWNTPAHEQPLTIQ